jgi:hypothetical protein
VRKGGNEKEGESYLQMTNAYRSIHFLSDPYSMLFGVALPQQSLSPNATQSNNNTHTNDTAPAYSHLSSFTKSSNDGLNLNSAHASNDSNIMYNNVTGDEVSDALDDAETPSAFSKPSVSQDVALHPMVAQVLEAMPSGNSEVSPIACVGDSNYFECYVHSLNY